MKRLFSRLTRAALFALALMPIHILLGHALAVSGWLMPAWFAVQTFTAALFTLVPAYVGHFKEYDVIKYVGSAGGDPNPDRQTEHSRVREGHRYPLRLTIDLLLLACLIAILLILPADVFLGARLLPKLVFAFALTLFMALAMRDIAMSACIWEDVPGICLGAILYIATAIYLRVSGNGSGLMNLQTGACAVGFLFLGAVTLNRQSVATSMATHSGDTRKPPRQVRRRNRAMSLGFAILVALVAFIEPIREGILWFFSMIGAGFRAISGFINSLFPSGEPLPPDTHAQFAQPVAEVAEVAPEAYETSLMSDIIVYAFFAVVGVAFIWMVFEQIRKMLKKLKLWMENFASGVGEGFYDEREKIIAEDEGDYDGRRGWLGRLRARLKREPGWDSLDGRARMRRLMRDLYARRAMNVTALRAMTAREAIDNIDTGRADKALLGEAYDRARYSDKEVGRDEADKLKKDARL